MSWGLSVTDWLLSSDKSAGLGEPDGTIVEVRRVLVRCLVRGVRVDLHRYADFTIWLERGAYKLIETRSTSRPCSIEQIERECIDEPDAMRKLLASLPAAMAWTERELGAL